MEENKKESFKEFLFITIASISLVLVIRTFVAQPFVVDGASMEPTFHSGEYLIVDQISYEFNNPQRGDVIIFRYPAIPSRFFIKRVIGLPGETLKIDGGKVFVKEKQSEEFKQVNEFYVSLTNIENSKEITLTEEEYFVMGDNRIASLDSRSWGPLNKDYIVGKAIIRLFPFNKIDLLPGN